MDDGGLARLKCCPKRVGEIRRPLNGDAMPAEGARIGRFIATDAGTP
jgi:hypothetical protein